MNRTEFRLAKHQLESIAADACKKAYDKAVADVDAFDFENPNSSMELVAAFEKDFGTGFMKYIRIQMGMKQVKTVYARATEYYKNISIRFTDSGFNRSEVNIRDVQFCDSAYKILSKELASAIKKDIEIGIARTAKLNKLNQIRANAFDKTQNFNKHFKSAMKTVEFNVLASSSEGADMNAMLKSMSKMLGEALGVKIV
jgi:ribosomal protein S20